uniref:Immunoglobulin domain-containing protein n=1 Tax=Cyprinus carpio TaxID=7962 RepID=A0A8C1WNA2_CYPCA
MFWIVLFCLCLWGLDGTFGYEEKLVTEGESVTLNSDFTEMKDDDRIQWKFGNEDTLLAEINKQTDSITVYDDVLDGRFRNRLKLNNQTGSLTITNTRHEHSGRYVLESKSVRKSFDIIIYGEKNVSVKIGDSVTLNTGLTEIMDNDRIKWKKDDVMLYGDVSTLLAYINKQSNRIAVYDDSLDGRFRDRLKLDNQTGSFTIRNTRPEHTGVYQLKINNARVDFLLTAYDEISVKEGDSITLNPRLTVIIDEIQWMFGNENTLIGRIEWFNGFTVYDDVLDGRFRNRLKLNKQTGSLTITNITTQHTGVYHLHISRQKTYFILSVFDSEHCCGSTEAVIRLVLSALVGVATVILLVYDIRSRRADQDQAHIYTSGSIET